MEKDVLDGTEVVSICGSAISPRLNVIVPFAPLPDGMFTETMTNCRFPVLYAVAVPVIVVLDVPFTVTGSSFAGPILPSISVPSSIDVLNLQLLAVFSKTRY